MTSATVRRRTTSRRAERLLLGLAAAWTLGLSVLTLFPYQAWFSSTGYDLLEQEQALDAAGLVSEAAAVIRIYGLVLIIAALVSAVIAWRMSAAHQPFVIGWLGVCIAGCLLTRDVVGVLPFLLCLVLYLSRSRAAGKAVPHPPTSTGEQ